MDDAETGEQLYVDTHDPKFRRRFGGGASGARRSWRPRSGAPGSMPSSLSTDEDLLAGDRPDGRAPEADRSASPMSFIWPPFLLLLLAVPVGVLAVSVAGAAAGGAGGAVRVGVVGGRGRAGGRRGHGLRQAPRPWTRRIPAALTVARHHDPRLLARPAAERHRRAAARGHGHPRVRRLGQHGRHRRRPDPHGGGQDRGARLHRGAAAVGPHRDRRLQRHRLLDPGADRRPGRASRPRSSASSRSAARPSAAASSQPLPSSTPTVDAVEDRLLHEPPTGRGRTPTPVPAGLYEPAIIVLLTDGENTVDAGPARGGAGGEGPRHPHRHGRDRQPGRRRRSKSRASSSTPSSTRRRSRTSRP